MPTTTFSVGSQANNGMVERVSTDYATISSGTFRRTAPTQDWAYRGLDGVSFSVDVILLAFDTSSLSDTATVNSATLRLNLQSVLSGDGARSLTAGYSAWDGTSNSDWVGTAQTDAHAGTALSSLTQNASNDLALINLTNINKTGITYIKVHISGGQPTLSNGAVVTFYDHATLAEPQLIVDWLPPTTRIAPDAILAQTNLTGAVSAIQDDPDSADASWLTAP